MLCDDCKQVFKDYYSISNFAEEIEEIDKSIIELTEKKKAHTDNKQCIS